MTEMVAFLTRSRGAPNNSAYHLFDGLYRGFVRCSLAPYHCSADFRAVPTIRDDQVEAFTLASFVVLNGQPGALPGS